MSELEREVLDSACGEYKYLTLPRLNAFVNTATGLVGSFLLLYEVSLRVRLKNVSWEEKGSACNIHPPSSHQPSKPSRRLCCRILKKVCLQKIAARTPPFTEPDKMTKSSCACHSSSPLNIALISYIEYFIDPWYCKLNILFITMLNKVFQISGPLVTSMASSLMTPEVL